MARGGVIAEALVPGRKSGRLMQVSQSLRMPSADACALKEEIIAKTGAGSWAARLEVPSAKWHSCGFLPDKGSTGSDARMLAFTGC